MMGITPVSMEKTPDGGCVQHTKHMMKLAHQSTRLVLSIEEPRSKSHSCIHISAHGCCAGDERTDREDVSGGLLASRHDGGLLVRQADMLRLQRAAQQREGLLQIHPRLIPASQHHSMETQLQVINTTLSHG